MPEVRSTNPPIVGDAPALADLSVTLGSTNTPLWALLRCDSPIAPASPSFAASSQPQQLALQV
jgi:hypothetical protein